MRQVGPAAARYSWTMTSRAVIGLIALLFAVFPALAHSTPPDPLWISGLWDAGDADVALGVASSDGAPDGVAPATLARPAGRGDRVRAERPSAPRLVARAAFDGRAPPASVSA